MLPNVGRPATSSSRASRKPTSPMAASRRRYMTPDPTISSSSSSDNNNNNNTIMNQPVPSLDLTKVGPSADIIRPETDRSSSTTTPMATPNVTLSTTENEWDSDLTSKAAKSVVAAPRMRPIPPPGGSARERGKFGGVVVVGGGSGGNNGGGNKVKRLSLAPTPPPPPIPAKYQKWMTKSVLEIRRANERATNPYSPLYKRANGEYKKRNKTSVGVRNGNSVGMNSTKKVSVHQDHMDMNNVTNNLHQMLSLGGLEAESVAMMESKKQNINLLRMRCDRLTLKADLKLKKLTWNNKEIERISRELGELKSLTEAADSSPEVMSLKNRLKSVTAEADREES